MNSEGILVVEPHGTLNEEDFARLTFFVDDYLADHADIQGVLIHSKSFPGWDSFAGFAAHIRFVRNHHQKVERVAVVTDSSAAHLAETLGKHFIAAEVKHFPYADYDKALNWLKALGNESRVGHDSSVQPGRPLH
jgi:hypothetical protein